MSNPLDDIDFSGDKHLSAEAKKQIDSLYEQGVVGVILKHFGVKNSEGHRWCQNRYGDPKLLCDCLPEVVPQLLQRFICTKLKFNLKRVTSLVYDGLEESALGEAVSMHGADQESIWLITDLPFMPGNIVVGKRSFPLETPFTGYVVAGGDRECYLLSNLRHFLQSTYCTPH